MIFDCLTDLVGINLCTFDGFGHGYVTDLMVWVLNKNLSVCIVTLKMWCLFSKILCTKFRSIKSSCISSHKCHINPFILL